jgi:hypothetical protein
VSIKSVLVGLKIFARHGDSHSTAAEHDIFFASQPSGKSLTKREVSTLFGHGWFIQSDICGGCAEEGDKARDTFFDPDDEEKARHRLDCRGWAVFV